MDVEDIKVAHVIPGRIRLKVAKVKENPLFAEEICRRLSAVQGILQVEANPVTGSVLVLYDVGALASLDSLRALSEPLTYFFPEFDVRELQPWLTSSSNGSSAAPSLAGNISAFLGTLNAGVGKVTGGVDLQLLLPLTLFFFGLRGLLVAEKVYVPAWYDFLWFSFGTFVMLNRPVVEEHQ